MTNQKLELIIDLNHGGNVVEITATPDQAMIKAKSMARKQLRGNLFANNVAVVIALADSKQIIAREFVAR